MTVRKKSYISFIERYPLYSTLLVLKEYEDRELYEECAIIRDALIDYQSKYADKFPKDLKFPTHLSVYKGKHHQDMLRRFNIVVEDKVAIEKATLIKLKLPVENGL